MEEIAVTLQQPLHTSSNCSPWMQHGCSGYQAHSCSGEVKELQLTSPPAQLWVPVRSHTSSRSCGKDTYPTQRALEFKETHPWSDGSNDKRLGLILQTYPGTSPPRSPWILRGYDCFNENGHTGTYVCMLSSQLWNCLGRTGRCGLVERSVLLGMSLKVSKGHTRPNLSLFLVPSAC